MNKKRKGFTLTELIAVIVILALLALIGIPAYNSIRAKVLENQYNNLVSLIETSAAKYASEKGVNLTNVKELVEEGLLETDDGESVLDPRDKSNMNCYLVEIEYKKGNFISKFIKEQECDLEKAKAERSKISIKTQGVESGKVYTNGDEWITEGVNLSVVKNELTVSESIVGYRWQSDNGMTSSEEIFSISTMPIFDSIVYVEGTTSSVVKLFAFTRVRIDKEKPLIKSVTQSSGNDWDKGRDVYVEATDQNGSGIAGYYVGTNANCDREEVKFVNNNNTKYVTNIESKNIYNETPYYVCVKDKAGNITKYAEDLKLQVRDTTAPNCVWSGENTSWKNAAVTIKLNCEDNESGCVTAEQTWDYSTTTETASLSYRIRDKAGNSRDCSKTVNVYVDTTAPTAPTTMNFVYGDWSAYPNDTWSKRDVYAGRSQSAKGPTGSTDANSGVAKYQISTDGITWYDFNYDYTSEMYKMSTDGTHTRYFRAVDGAGNSSASISRVAKIDKTAPTAPTTMNFVYGDWSIYSNNTWTNRDVYAGRSRDDQTPTGSTDETSGVLKYQISKDGTTWVDFVYDYTSDMYKMSTEGTHTRYFRAVDRAGNVSASINRVAKIDKTAPGVPTSEIRKTNSSGDEISNSSSWRNYKVWWGKFSSDAGSGSPIDRYDYSTDCTGTDSGNLNTTNGYTYTNHNYKFCIRAVDKAGNASAWSSAYYFKVDTTAPTCGSISGGSTYWTSGNRTVTLGCSDSGSKCAETYTKTYSSGTIKTATWKQTIKDNAGNETSCSKTVNVYVDKDAPTISFGTNGSGTSWVSQASTTVSASDSGSGIKSIKYGFSTSSTSKTANTSVSSGGKVSNTCSISGTTGDCYLYVKACDNKDNCSEKTSSAFKIDRAKPTVTFTNTNCLSRCTDKNSVACKELELTDAGSGIAKIARSHCWKTSNTVTTTSTGSTRQRCEFKKDGNLWTAQYRLTYFRDYGETYNILTGDSKTAMSDYTGSKFIFCTTASNYIEMQYAAYAYDKVGNRSDMKTATKAK